jgi:Peptidase family M48
MVRHIVFAVLACLYVAASVLLVQSQGEAYRKTSRRTPTATSDTSAASARRNADEAKKTVEVETVSSTALSQRDKPLRNSSPPPERTPPTQANEGKTPPSREPIKVTTTQPSFPTALTQPVNRPPDNAPLPAGRLDLEGVWKEPFATKSWNLDNLSVEDENELGNGLHYLILQLNAKDEGPGLLRIEEAARPLLALCSRKEIEYRFTILSSVIPNVFSHPGGFIYISRKLLDMIPEDQDEVLQFVIGNEIAHVDMKHAIQCLRSPSVKRFQDCTLWKLYFLIIPHAYPDELEFAADQWAYRKMKQIGRSDYECLRFLRILESYAREQGFADGRRNLEDLFKINGANPRASAIISPLDNHLRAHTAPKRRLDQLKLLRDHVAKGAK